MTPSASSASSPSSLSSLPTLATADSGTSTTLDVTLCLLLVSAAVGVLAAAGPPVDDHDPRTADAVADRLTATTVAVDYVLGSGDGTNTPLEGTASVAARERTVQGTPAALLARAAVADLAVADGAVVGSTPAEASPFERAVANRTGRVVADVDASVNVTATYAPVPGSDVHGRATVGPKPPADADVSVVRVRVPVGRGDSGVHAERATARGADRDGFAGVARVLADATVSTVLPTSRARWALRDAATAGVVAARYHALGRALGVDVDAALDGGDVERANENLASALADRFERALREQYDTPEDAANATANGWSATAGAGSAPRPRTVTVTVRTWYA